MSVTRSALAAVALLGSTAVATAHDYWVYLGTYTGKESKGIYRAKLDAHTGKLSEPELAAEVGSPSFLAISPDKKFLYAVGEGGGKDGGGVFAFALDAKTGALKKLESGTSGGAGPCHISVSPDGKKAAVANYGGGSTALFEIAADGGIGKRIGFVQHKGSGANPARQKEPHAHCTFFSPDGSHLLTVDLGIDKVKVFKVDATGLKEDEKLDIALPPGAGPRHIAIAPDGKFAYVCGEIDSTVNVVELSVGKSDGSGKTVQTLSTLPEPTKGNSTAECILSPNGKFVYVSNRGHNSIAVFAIGADRKLTAVGHIKGDIKTPRNFNIDPSGEWMLIASQAGGKVGVYKIDEKTGLAKETDVAAKVASCVCVKFVPVAK